MYDTDTAILREPQAETPEPEPDTEPEPAPEQETSRCEAETTVGGTLYRCALGEGHEDDHRFQPAADEPPPPAAPAHDMDKALRQLTNEAKRHAEKVRTIMGEDADGLILCELCSPNLAGWRFDVAPDEETSKRVRIAIGLPDVSNFAMSSTERLCDDCRGLGKVRTGSLVPGRETTVCDACQGRGWVSSRPRLNPVDEAAATDTPTNGAAVEYNDGIKRDMFGTPEGDPDYEKLPGARIRPVDYWQQNRV